MEYRKITCDFCERDLTTSEDVQAYSLHLKVRSIPINSITLCGVNIIPPLKSNKDFCGLECLTEWLNKGISGDKE